MLENDGKFSVSGLAIDVFLFPAAAVLARLPALSDLPVLWTLQMLQSSMYFATAVLGR